MVVALTISIIMMGIFLRTNDIFLFAVTKQEVETLLVNFRKVKKEDGPAKLDRNTFRDVLQNTFMMTDDIIMDRGK